MCVYTHMQAHMAAHTKKPQQSSFEQVRSRRRHRAPDCPENPSVSLKVLGTGPFGNKWEAFIL